MKELQIFMRLNKFQSIELDFFIPSTLIEVRYKAAVLRFATYKVKFV